MTRELRDAMWDDMRLGSPYGEVPSRADPDDTDLLVQGLAQVGDKNEYLSEVFSHPADTLPPSRRELVAQLPDGRLAAAPRLFHRFGACAKVRLNVERASPYTGLLGPGVEVHGIVRASLTSSRVFSPGLGLKWFVRRGPTVNLLFNHSFEGFDEDDGFFAERLRTKLDLPQLGLFANPEAKAGAHAALGFLMGALAWWRARAAERPPDPLQIDLEPMCSVDLHGESVRPCFAPAFLVVRGEAAANREYNRGSGDFRPRLERIPPGPLLRVEDDEGAQIGMITLEDRFVASAGGDTALFFRHPFAP